MQSPALRSPFFQSRILGPAHHTFSFCLRKAQHMLSTVRTEWGEVVKHKYNPRNDKRKKKSQQMLQNILMSLLYTNQPTPTTQQCASKSKFILAYKYKMLRIINIYLYTTYSTGYTSLTSTMDSEPSSVRRFVALGIHLKGDGAQI